MHLLIRGLHRFYKFMCGDLRNLWMIFSIN